MKQEWNKKRVVPPGTEIPGISTRKLVKEAETKNSAGHLHSDSSLKST